jgi:tRNA(Ile)-lysidine synthase
VTPLFEKALSAFNPPLPLLVALSGGADSTALLVACARRWPGQVRAIHIHHGLQSAADDFVRQCEQLCAHLQVPLVIRHVNAQPRPQESPEDAARKARYGALDEFLASSEGVSVASVALAHHADDQVETMLLALSRGTGVAGIAAMPGQWRRAGLPWFRPLLGVPGSVLRSWLVQQQITWVDDPTNTEMRYTRNRIRAQLLPALESVFPAFRETFVRSAAHAADTAQLLQELAEADLAQVGSPPSIRLLQGLSGARLANVLRYWLKVAHRTTPSAAQMAELQHQIAACSTRGHQIRIKVGRGFVVREGAVLGWCDP